MRERNTVYGDYAEETESTATEKTEAAAKTDRLALSDNAQPAYGHAKNKRCDLKQMTLLLATTGKSGFPVWMESHSGNASDKKTLEEAASRVCKNFCVTAIAPPLSVFRLIKFDHKPIHSIFPVMNRHRPFF